MYTAYLYGYMNWGQTAPVGLLGEDAVAAALGVADGRDHAKLRTKDEVRVEVGRLCGERAAERERIIADAQKTPKEDPPTGATAPRDRGREKPSRWWQSRQATKP